LYIMSNELDHFKKKTPQRYFSTREREGKK